jgi:hypothetical protein
MIAPKERVALELTKALMIAKPELLDLDHLSDEVVRAVDKAAKLLMMMNDGLGDTFEEGYFDA